MKAPLGLSSRYCLGAGGVISWEDAAFITSTSVAGPIS